MRRYGTYLAIVGWVGGCSLSGFADGFDPSSDGPMTDGASVDASDRTSKADGAVPEGDASPVPMGDAGPDAARTFCQRATHTFCEDFDDPAAPFPGRWTLETSAGGTATLDVVGAPRAALFSIPKTATEGADASLTVSPGVVVKRGVFAFDVKFGTGPDDNYNFGLVRFGNYDLSWLVKPDAVSYFEQSSGGLFTEFSFRPSLPSGWHRFSMTFDAENKTVSSAFDGTATASHDLNAGFAPANPTLAIGIHYSRANAGPATVWVDNVTFDVMP
jgi:hypothetical protein